MVLRSSVGNGTSRAAIALFGEKFPDEIEGAHSESDLAQEDGLDSDESDNSKEEGNKSGHLKLQEEEEGQQLLDLLLLLATSWKKKISF